MLAGSRFRRGGLFTIGVVALCLLGAGSFGAVSARADGAVINVTYTSPTAFQLKLGSGAVVPSGGSIPAGSYTILVYDSSEDNSPKFAASGPGVSVSSDLNSTGMGIDIPTSLGPYNFQSGATYTFEDSIVGPSSRVTFSVTAGASTGSTSGGSTSSGSTSSGSTSGSSSGSTSSGSTSGSSSTGTKMAGTLVGTVSSAGKPMLTFGGKVVKTLKAGAYKVTVADHSAKVGLIVWKQGAHPIMISGAAKTGTGSRMVALSTGKWFFEPSTSGPKTYFTVT